MGSTPSPELVGITIANIILITITIVIILTAITYFNYKYTEIMYNNIRLGHIYIFDAFTKYKQSITVAVISLFIVLFVFRVTVS
jgi:hypothetical protein